MDRPLDWHKKPMVEDVYKELAVAEGYEEDGVTLNLYDKDQKDLGTWY